MSYSRNRWRRKAVQNEDVALQITSMADIFTILLVFLLKSYSTGAFSVSPSQGVRLPAAKASDEAVESLKVEISATAVQIEGKPIVTLDNFKMSPKELRVLDQAFAKERQRQNLIAKSNTDVKVDSKIMVLADQDTPYPILKSVLSTAAVQGYSDFKLVVAQEN